MLTPAVTTIDFETEGIQQRPCYPPKPVGFSIKNPGDKRSKYYSWGHPTENNCTKSQAQDVLRGAWRGDYQLLFQNGKFDVDVAETHMAMKPLSWDKIHDTLFLLFLQDPHARSLSLKPSAERLLGIKPEERDVLKEWILKNVPEAKRKPSQWGAYICKAPGTLVGKYADGDVLRTEKLYKFLYKEIDKRSMMKAYDRERHLMPIMLRNEREGVKVDLPALERDYKLYTESLEKADAWLRKRLGAPTLNVDADADMSEALDRSGVVTEWVFTKTGKRSTAKDNMTPDMFVDRKVASVYGYRQRLQTCIGTFYEPWLAVARQTGGIIYTTWNQVRQTHGNEKGAGARTGRFSSSPNFQNIPKNWKKALAEGYVWPKFLRVPDLPRMRTYFLPDHKDDIWGRRDYNQQELRILAHFEDGPLMEAYNTNPRLDIHEDVQDGILEVAGLDLPRDPVKILNFGDIYGRGIAELAKAMGVDIATAKRVRQVKDQLLPGIPQLNMDIKALAKQGLPIRTWGGREYYVEEPMYVAKFQRVMSFEYKLLNYLVQGSAADCTKESIIRYDEHPKRRGRFLITVHDENNISAHKKVFKQEMKLLQEVMQSVEFDVTMLSDGEYGPNWGTLTKEK